MHRITGRLVAICLLAGFHSMANAALECANREIAVRVALAIEITKTGASGELGFYQLALTNPEGYTGLALASISRDSAGTGVLGNDHDPDNGFIEAELCVPNNVPAYFGWLLYAVPGEAPDIADAAKFEQFGGTVVELAKEKVLVLGRSSVDCAVPGGVFDVIEDRFQAYDRSDPDVQAVCVSSAEEHLKFSALREPALLGPPAGAAVSGNQLYVVDYGQPLQLSPLVDHVVLQNGTIITAKSSPRSFQAYQLVLETTDKEVALCLDKTALRCFIYKINEAPSSIAINAPASCATGAPIQIEVKFVDDLLPALWRKSLALQVDGQLVVTAEDDIASQLQCPAAGTVQVVAVADYFRLGDFGLGEVAVGSVTQSVEITAQ